MKTQPIAFRGRLFTITTPRTGTPRLTNTPRTSEALQVATSFGRSLPRSTNMSTIETIPTDQANLRAVQVLRASPRLGLCAHGAPSGKWTGERGGAWGARGGHHAGSGREEAGKPSDDVDTELDNGGWIAVLPLTDLADRKPVRADVVASAVLLVRNGEVLFPLGCVEWNARSAPEPRGPSARGSWAWGSGWPPSWSS